MKRGRQTAEGMETDVILYLYMCVYQQHRIYMSRNLSSTNS